MPIPQVPSQLMNILASKTYNAAWFSGTTVEEQIQNAIDTAAADGATMVFIPASMLPYNAVLVVFNTSVRMVREGNLTDVFDVEAYGAVGDGVTTDTTSLLAAIGAAEAAGGDVVLVAGHTYLCNQTIALHQTRITCSGAATIKFSGLGASTDCITIQGSTAQHQAGLQGVRVDCNGSGRDGVVFAGGRVGAASSDFARLHRVLVTGAIRDGIHMEPAAASFWIENTHLSDIRIENSGRHGIAFVCPDLSTVFINKGLYHNVEIRGSGQLSTGYEIYAENSGSVSGMHKVAEHVWIGTELDAAGGANHGANAIRLAKVGSVSEFDGWTFVGPTFEDTGSVAGLAKAIEITGGAAVRGLTILAAVMADYTGIVDETLLTGNALVISANLNLPLIRLSDSSGNTMVMVDNTLQWRASGGSLDTNLYREDANRLFTDDLLGAAHGFRQLRTPVTSTAGAITLVDGTSQVNLSENVTAITMPTAIDGKAIEVQFKQDPATPRTVAGWPGTVRLSGGAFTVTATVNKIDTISFRYNSGVAAWVEITRSLNI